jgi:hypothetical protein
MAAMEPQLSDDAFKKKMVLGMEELWQLGLGSTANP